MTRRKGRRGSGRRRGEGGGGGRSGAREGRRARSRDRKTGWSELEANVVRALTESTRGPLKSKDIARVLSIPADDYRAFKRGLLEMQKKGTIYRVRGQRYALSSSIDLVTGPVSMTRDGPTSR